MGRNRISVFRPVVASIVVLSLIGVSHGYFNGNINNNIGVNSRFSRQNIQIPVSDAIVAVNPGVYGQGLQSNLNEQYQYQPQQPQYYHQQNPQVQLQQVQLQAQPSMLVHRVGRNYQSMGRAGNDDEEDEYLDQEFQEDDHDPISHAPSKKKKKGSKKKEEELSFPRRMMKKTTSAIKNTAGAVFGAPKYIFTRYRDTYGFGKKKAPQKKKEKGKGHDEKGWGWDHHDEHHDNHGWGGWDSRSGSASPDEYERKNGERYNYKRYLYKPPGNNGGGARESRPVKGALSSLYAWTG